MPRVIAAWKSTSRLEVESLTWEGGRGVTIFGIHTSTNPGKGKEGHPIVGDDVHPNGGVSAKYHGENCHWEQERPGQRKNSQCNLYARYIICILIVKCWRPFIEQILEGRLTSYRCN